MSIDRDTFLSLLHESVRAQATDIHFKVPARPRLRVQGELVETALPPLMPEDTFAAAREILRLAHREMPLATVLDEQVAFGVQGVGRFRAHLYRQRGSIGIIVHRMAFEIPRLADLGVSPDIGDLAWAGAGISFVTGGRTRHALLAALVDHFNRGRAGHLVSIEQPMEYLHRDARAAVAQREVPGDTPSIAEGLRASLSADCDAIAVSEIPDEESADLALRLAESGRPVVAGLPGCPAHESVRWFSRIFRPHREREVLDRLEAALVLVMEYNGEAVRVLRADAERQAG